jgi:hypothetical protein
MSRKSFAYLRVLCHSQPDQTSWFQVMCTKREEKRGANVKDTRIIGNNMKMKGKGRV